MTAMMEAVGLRVAVASRVRSHPFRPPPIEIVRGVALISPEARRWGWWVNPVRARPRLAARWCA